MIIFYALTLYIFQQIIISVILATWMMRNGQSPNFATDFIKENSGKFALLNLAQLMISFWWASMLV